jgi:DMSO/TMAO reductase YedYZ heme-binding membrane subunit
LQNLTLLSVYETGLKRIYSLGRPLWRRLHYLVFPAAVLFFLHSILTDPNLKNGHPDLLDGGKVFVEAASFLSFIAVTIRYRLRGKELRQEPPERSSKQLSPESPQLQPKSNLSQ